MTTTAPTVPAPTAAPAPAVPTPPAPAPAPPLAPSAPASRRSVYLLAAAIGCLAVAGLLYVLVDRPGLREPLESVATIVTAITGVAGVVWGISRAPR
ncbi:hypothetical protein [Streptomyces cyaneofuscatus]|uniref:hypothetical protein n=1 Tax=Streptomyces cyaneofuscatus TaxID=66883 RepID=UPI0033B5FFE4